MASTTGEESFSQGWDQTASWAQAQGYKYNQYFPVYQKDVQRFQQDGAGSTMSQAERERAITAAANPNQISQLTPSTAPNPTNIIGNTITDARNIFTGLGDIVAHPTDNGLVDSVKNTFDLIDGSHHLQGTNAGAKIGDALTSTVLAFVPGAADVGNVLKLEYGPGHNMGWRGTTGDPGFAYLAEHPLASILDLSGLGRFGGVLKDTQAGTALERTGFADQRELLTAGPLRLTKALVLHKKTSELGPGGYMTIGEKLNRMGGRSLINTNPAIADVSLGASMEITHGDNVLAAVFDNWWRTTKDLNDDQAAQVYQVLERSQTEGLDKAMAGVTDPKVEQAVRTYDEDINSWAVENALNARDGPVLIPNLRTGKTEMFSVGGHGEVIRTRDALQKAVDNLNGESGLPDAERNVAETTKIGNYFTQTIDKLDQANQAARKLFVKGDLGVQLLGRSKRFPTRFSRQRLAQSVVGTGGWIDNLIEKARAGEYETVRADALSALKRMREWNAGRGGIDVQNLGPEFQAVQAQVTDLFKLADAMVKKQKEGRTLARGAARKERLSRPIRDEAHKRSIENLKTRHDYEVSHKKLEHEDQAKQLRTSFRVQSREITARFAKQRSDRANTLADGTRNINQRYTLAKKELRNRHLLARQTHQELVRTRTAQGFAEALVLPPGAAGSPEAIEAGLATLEAARKGEIADLVASLPTLPELAAKQALERQTWKHSNEDMLRQLKEAQKQDLTTLAAKQQEERDQLEAENAGKTARDGPFSQKVDAYLKADKDFRQALYRHPADNKQPLFTNLLIKNLLEDERARDSIMSKARVWARKYGKSEEEIDQLHKNKRMLAELVQMGFKDTMDDPIFEDLDQALMESATRDAYAALDQMSREGVDPYWVHQVSQTQIKNNETGSAGIRLILDAGKPKPNILEARTWGLAGNRSKFDIQVSGDHMVKQFLQRAGFQNFVKNYLDNKVWTEQQLFDTVNQFAHPEAETAGMLGYIDTKLDDWNLAEFNPEQRFGFRAPRWGQGKVYIDKDVLKAVEKLSERGGLLKGSLIEKGTKLFRFSILGLSPRYTAHIVFGGTFLLAMREPLFFLHVPEMLRRMKEGDLPEDAHAGATQMGTPEWQMKSHKELATAYGNRWGQDSVRYMQQEHIEKVQKVPWREANPVHWIKALAQINLDFTTTVIDMQRSLALIAGEHRAADLGMTEERQVYEGMKAAYRVFGDMRRMSPFERDVARTAMPFYSWQKHILQFVFTYPGDHPWRALMLAQMAEYDSQHTPGGLPTRYQFLSFLGNPDAQGNVTVIDTRALNPLRDTANYATWQGIISSLNPAVTGVLTAINPQIIYGDNPIYPNLTYDQFYGIDVAGPQGNLLTSAEQFVPQIGGMQSALKLVGERQGMNNSQLIKSIANQLNFPWVPQTINLRQEAAQTAIDEYHVTSNLAKNAWQTGNFQPIADLGSVPDPRNADYETPVSELEQLYNELQTEYPGVPPSESAPPLPSVLL